MSCRIIAITNQKGGIGKTTTCQSIGVTLHMLGYKVLCCDIDAQSHLSVAFNITRPESLESSLTSLIETSVKKREITKEDVQKAIIHTATVDLLPSTYALEDLEVALNSITDREYAIFDILGLVKYDYDFILLDCNSSRNIFTINALASADEIVIPCQTQYLSAGGIDLALSMVAQLKRRINPALKVTGILLTMFQSNTNQSRSTVAEVQEKYGERVFETIIPNSTKVPDAQKAGKSIIEYMEDNPVSKAYISFVEKELIR